MKPYNPFLVYGYNSPEYFCDRERETDKMISALLNERNLTLISPRRMGKTGLIQSLLNKELIYNTPDGYIVYDRFFGKWLKDAVI